MSSFEKLVQQMDREDEDDYEDEEEHILDATFAMEVSAMSRKTRKERKYVRRRINPLTYFPEATFKRKFGFEKATVYWVYDHVREELEPKRHCKNNISAMLKLLTFITFVRKACYQEVIGDLFYIRMSQAAVCQHANKVSKVIARLSETFIDMPSLEERKKLEEEVFAKTGFPGSFASIDGSHVRIPQPEERHCPNNPPHHFFNRKGFYSINVMLLADHNLKIRFVSARYPGHSHDYKIYKESVLNHVLNEQFDPNYPLVILGDEAYASTNVIVTPIRDDGALSPAQKEFNLCHSKARLCVEHTFGMLKKRMPVLLRGTLSDVSNSQAIIIACCVMHNITLLLKDNCNDEEIATRAESAEGYSSVEQNESYLVRNQILNYFRAKK